MNIDIRAPIVARKEIVINASIDRIWDILTDVNHWPDWQKKITTVVIDGNVQRGRVFFWKSRGMNIRSELLEVIPNTFICWTGTTMGTYAIHNWTLATYGSKTRIVTEESMSGWLPFLMKLVTPRFLHTSLQQTLEALKIQAEKREI